MGELVMGQLAGKRSLVTGAGQGIGRAVAEAFAREGASVVATDIDLELLRGFESDRIVTELLDVTSSPQIEELSAKTGPIDTLVNCAGFVHTGSILEVSPEEWDLSFSINVRSIYLMVRGFLPGILEVGGCIINVASTVSSIKAAPDRCAYAASKAAVIGLTKSIARDFIRDGVRCNAICPGTILSPSLQERMRIYAERTPGGMDAAIEEFIGRSPMGRAGSPEEVAALAVYLASDAARFTTGTTQIIDGGFTL